VDIRESALVVTDAIFSRYQDNPPGLDPGLTFSLITKEGGCRIKHVLSLSKGPA
jgi:hypothetical protein